MAIDKRKFRLTLYLMPAMLDCITGIFIFIGPVRATLMGYDPLVAGSLVTARSVACCLVGILLSRIITPRNAIKLMFFSNIMLVWICLLGLAATNLTMLYVTTGLVGTFQVIFFSSFQLFMKMADEDDSKPLSRVVGSYTLAWCAGMSLGPFITGIAMRIGRTENGVGEGTGWMYAYLAAVVLTLALLAVLVKVSKESRAVISRRWQGETIIGKTTAAAEGRPNLAWLGWFMGFFGLASSGIVKGVFPSGATRAGMPEWRSGAVMMTMALATGIFAYMLSRRWRWLYSGASMLGFGLLGAAGLLFFLMPSLLGQGIADQAWQYYLAALIFGCYCGVAYLYSGFHALVHPQTAGRNISLNECFISGGAIVGPLLGGWTAREYGFYTPFALASILVGVLGAFQYYAHRKYGAIRQDCRPPLGKAA
ncbi:MAG: MFS transporter [Planctomycetota bacterium]|nr:MFS transporter [Planctomycetota bacterium]